MLLRDVLEIKCSIYLSIFKKEYRQKPSYLVGSPAQNKNQQINQVNDLQLMPVKLQLGVGRD